jgi:hypothetical protein
MANIGYETTIILDKNDAASIFTEALCRYGPLDNLRVEFIKPNVDEDFVLTLTPKPKEEAE